MYRFTGHKLTIELIQKKPAKLPYYGPIARGWLGSILCDDPDLRDLFFKCPQVDVRPFMMHTTHENNCVKVNVTLIGYGKQFLVDIITHLNEHVHTHLGGVDAKITNLHYEPFRTHIVREKKRYTMQFKSPIHLEKKGHTTPVPSLPDLVRNLNRSINRFSKYYLHSIYPYELSPEVYELNWDIHSFQLHPLFINHRSWSGGEIQMNGYLGQIQYSIEPSRELRQVFGLFDVFQIGRWIPYGFGKIEVM